MTVHYLDGAIRTANVTIKVAGASDPTKDSSRYFPLGADIDAVPIGTDASYFSPELAGQHISNATAMPAETSYDWYVKPDTATAGDKAAVIKVIFPDTSTAAVPIVVHVVDKASQRTTDPQAQTIYQTVGDAQLTDSDAVKGIANSGDLGAVTYSFNTDNGHQPLPDPTHDPAGTYPVVIRVTYQSNGQDSGFVDVPTLIVIKKAGTKDADKSHPQFKTINLPQSTDPTKQLTNGLIKKAITNLDDPTSIVVAPSS